MLISLVFYLFINFFFLTFFISILMFMIVDFHAFQDKKADSHWELLLLSKIEH